jgi:hypothetical protein
MASTPFSVSQENNIRMAAMCCFDRGRRGLALKGLDVGGHRDGLNVFKVLVSGALPSCKFFRSQLDDVADYEADLEYLRRAYENTSSIHQKKTLSNNHDLAVG